MTGFLAIIHARNQFLYTWSGIFSRKLTTLLWRNLTCAMNSCWRELVAFGKRVAQWRSAIWWQGHGCWCRVCDTFYSNSSGSSRWGEGTSKWIRFYWIVNWSIKHVLSRIYSILPIPYRIPGLWKVKETNSNRAPVIRSFLQCGTSVTVPRLWQYAPIST